MPANFKITHFNLIGSHSPEGEPLARRDELSQLIASLQSPSDDASILTLKYRLEALGFQISDKIVVSKNNRQPEGFTSRLLLKIQQPNGYGNFTEVAELDVAISQRTIEDLCLQAEIMSLVNIGASTLESAYARVGLLGLASWLFQQDLFEERALLYLSSPAEKSPFQRAAK